jgi:arylsulfatase A
MDRLAAGGMIFTDAHSGSAVCTPTRYGILTGRYCWRTRLESGESVDYTKPISGGPLDLGFDTFFGIPASLDMLPYVYVENDRVVAAPAKTIEGTEDFRGKSGIGPYGDFVLQCDWTVGQIMQALDRYNMTDNTLFIVTSDNGCSPMADFEDLAQQGHHPSYHFRGYKADIYEGGHRIPFIARWPANVKPGSTCDDTICLTDLVATLAAILTFDLPENAGEDSVSILPDFLGKATGPVREATIHHSINGSFSLRQGKWKLEFCPGSAGWSYPQPAEAKKLGLPRFQLYDLDQDIGERNNVMDKHPEVVERLTELLAKYVGKGRSTPGKPQKNGTVPFRLASMSRSGIL